MERIEGDKSEMKKKEKKELIDNNQIKNKQEADETNNALDQGLDNNINAKKSYEEIKSPETDILEIEEQVNTKELDEVSTYILTELSKYIKNNNTDIDNLFK